MKYLILLMLSATLSLGAITEKYVTDEAAGGGDGSSGSPYTFAEMVTQINANTAAGTRYNLKLATDGTHSIGSTTTFTGGGTLSAPVIIRGYSSTITDGFLGRSPENGTLVTTNMPVIAWANSGHQLSFSTTGYIVLENLQIQTATLGIGVNAAATAVSFVRCKITNSSTDANTQALSLNVRAFALDCDIANTGASGGIAAVSSASAMARIIGCRIQTTSTTAYTARLTGHVILVDNLLIGGAGVRVNDASAAPFIYGNTIVNSSGDGVSIITGAIGPQAILNNHITDNAGGGVDLTNSSNAGWITYNRFRDNGTSVENGNDWQSAIAFGQIDDGTTGTTATDYVDYGAGDFRLIPTAPATSAGFPVQRSIGAYQLNQEGGVGSSTEKSHTFVQ